MTRYQQVMQLAFVKRAIELGWKSDSLNPKSRRHFYFLRPGIPVQVSLYAGCSDWSFTVGNTSVNYEPKAIELLGEKLAERGAR